ncbi:apolipoprotein L3-like [Moschus berezovskii]|uniref:apolipoprotein L3-like n=1 Tax=Moschus berezovskii TaxID=68408 RepID=UPI002444CC12|nr:apolipoprotein L3-like [Moschus berezovskii]XP_055251983.1 apolipoprotein L3-like [Moschus berezovskii]
MEALCEFLNELKTDLAIEDQERFQQDLLDRESFLKEFPQVKKELEESIRKLYALADRVDKSHRDCTIFKVVANSTSTVSGVLNILGLALAPVTAGASLVLSTTGLGLGAAATVTTMSTSIMEHFSRSSAETEASGLLSTNIKEKVSVGARCLCALRMALSTAKVYRSMQEVRKNVHAAKLVKDNSQLAAHAKSFTSTGQVSVQTSKEVKEAFKGTALAMTKKARIIAGGFAGIFLLVDVGFLVKESMHLHEGAKTELAEKLRQQARKLEERLKEVIQTYERLKQGLTSPAPEQCRNQGHTCDQGSEHLVRGERRGDNTDGAGG